MGHHCLVVISVVETLHFLKLVFVDTTCLEVFYRSIDRVVVVRIVLEGIYFVGEATLECLREVDVGLVGVSAHHKLGLNILAKKARPLGEGLDLDVEGRVRGMCEGIVRYDDAIFNALCRVFELRVFNNVFYGSN